MKQKCYKILESIDNLGKIVNLSVNGEKEIHSVTGIVLTLITLVVSIVTFYSLIFELFKKDKPTVNYNKIMVDIPGKIPFNSNIFMFAIGIKDQYYNFIDDETYLSIEAIYEYHTILNGQIQKQEIPLQKENCSKFVQNFKELGLYNFYETNVKLNYYCYNPIYNNNKKVYIGGLYGTKFYGNVAFHIKPCISRADITCKSREQITEKVNKGWLQIVYSNGFIDNYNYSNPIHYSTLQYYNNLDVNLNKIIYLNFNPVNVYTENNIILDTKYKETSVKEDYQKSDINQYIEGGDFYTVYVCPSNTVEEYKRKYIKIQTIGSQIGGIFNCLYIVSYAITCLINEKILGMKLINYLFKFSDENEKVQFDIFRLKNYDKKPVKKQIHFNFLKNDINNSFEMKSNRKFVNNTNVKDNNLNNSNLPIDSNNNYNKLKIHVYKKLERKSINNSRDINKVEYVNNKDILNKSMSKADKNNNNLNNNIQQKDLSQGGSSSYTINELLFRRITVEQNKIYNDNYVYEIYFSFIVIIKLILCQCSSSAKRNAYIYKVLLNEVDKYLDIIKIYHNFIQFYMISMFIKKKYQIDLKYEKDNISINAFKDWSHSKKIIELKAPL